MPDEHRRCVLCQHRRRKSDDRRYWFGLLGHLSEMCQGAGVQARVDYDAIPKIAAGLKSTLSWAQCLAAPNVTLPATVI